MKYVSACQVCGVAFVRVESAKRPAPKHCSRACANRAPGRMTVEIRARIGRPREQHPNYKGGWLGTDGHYRVGKVMRSHIAWNEAHPHDPVQRGEVIHHKNEDPTDDRPDNLEKLANQKVHAKLHFAGVPKSREHVEKQRLAQMHPRSQ